MGYNLELKIGYLKGENEVSIKRKFIEIIEETGVTAILILFKAFYIKEEQVTNHWVEIIVPLEDRNNFQAHTKANKILKEQVDPVLKKYELKIIQFNVESGE